ncbi:hypothetical protein [Haloarchaeobius sp. HME9146]|uniref:hypothetical protein n=1 Tax=Haloarchaeobius sp. HME9146 TaxID=2978732 RepID=UPI0021BE3B38|nr:hypothetical protein [Haloarchaeobius sp. HME9146]MCT9096774.1 hypothetical protein [Haloarchaeobius sp. HME9146]
MSVSRRTVLQGGGIAAVLSLAGCLEGFAFGGGGSPNVSGPTTNFVYDHGDLLEGNLSFFMQLDGSALGTTRVPQETEEKIEDSVDAVGSVDELLAVGYVKTGSKQQAGGTLMARGSVDSGAVATDLVRKGLRDAGGHAGYDIYRADVTGGIDIATAVAGNAIVYGVGSPAVPAVDAVTTMIDAGSGKATRRLDESSGARALVNRYTSRETPPTGYFVVELDDKAVDDMFPSLDAGVRDLFRGARAAGFAFDVNGGGTNVEALFLYDTPNDVAAGISAAEALFARMASDDPNLPAPLVGAWNTKVTNSDSAVAVTFGTETESLWELVVGPFLGLATDLTDIDTSAAPNVGFSYRYRDDARVTITHEAGDAFQNVKVVYTSFGERVTEDWKKKGDVVVGDKYTTKNGVSFDEPLQVIWYGGNVPIIIGQYDPTDDDDEEAAAESETA